LSDPEPFYFPPPSLFGHPAFDWYTTFAADLEKAGLRNRFPEDEPEVRYRAIEILAEHEGSVDKIVDDPYLDRYIAGAIEEAREVLRQQHRDEAG
jgi:hypothetical protein